jgi:hypothetical protein
MTRQERLQELIYTYLHTQLDASIYRDSSTNSIRLAYELGLLVAALARLAAEDSLVEQDLRRLLGRRAQ